MARAWAWRFVTVTCAIGAFAHVAGAAPIAVAPAPTTLAEGLGSALRESVSGGIAAAGLATIPSRDVDAALAARPGIARCVTDVCLSRLAEMIHARGVVRMAVEVLGSSNYTFRLELVDAEVKKTIVRVDDSCAICTTREANDAISRAAAALAKQLPAEWSVVPAPPASEKPSTSTFTPPAPTWNRRSKLLLGFGIATTILGAGAIGGGAGLLAIDGRVESSSTDPVTGDPIVIERKEKIPGGILIGAGGLLVVGGAVMLWRAVHEHRHAH